MTGNNSAGDNSASDVQAAGVEGLWRRLDEMEGYVKRRFDELSVEVNAASQLVGMSEDSVKHSLGEVIGLLHAISSSADARSRVQAGVELDAVVKITEDAANRILDAADRIAGRLDDHETWGSQDSREAAIEETRDDVQEILMACAFQDITGQRIERTLQNLQDIESKLTRTLAKFGLDVDQYRESAGELLERGGSQDEIDSLFETADSSGGTASQDAVDSLFDDK